MLNLSTAGLALLVIASLVILLIALDLSVEAILTLRVSGLVLLSALLVAAALLPAQVVAELGTGHMHVATYFLSMPLFGFIAYLLLLLLLEGALARKLSILKKEQLGVNSVKESVDNLPDGICFSKLDGTPLLVNRQMQEISYQVFGKKLVNDLLCARDIEANRIKPRTKILQREPLIVESNSKVWQIKIIHHGLVKETLAYDITLEWALYEEIEKMTRANQRMNAELKAYREKIGEYTRQKETLQAKIKIHDRLGQALIYFRRYLEKAEKTPEDRRRLETLWGECLLLFGNEEEPVKVASAWDKFITTAGAIGVDVMVEGEVPESKEDQALLVELVHEALNNAIRHGHAKKIWITLKDQGPTFTCCIKNDGDLPTGPVEEKGGLKNMRQRLAYYDGSLAVRRESLFELDLSWTKGGFRDV